MSDNLEILRDSWLGSELSVVESIDTPKGEYSSVVLATLKGPALDYTHDTRNGRGYLEELWDEVVTGKYVKELFDTKNFLGEPDHPMQWENRSDIHYPYVSHAIRELTKRPDLGCYEVVIDILDTPNGRILKTLIDYGVKLGVSSRGSGRTIQRNGRTIVDPKTYRFITIDIVPMPGYKDARMNNVNESLKLEGLISALSEQLEFLSESNNMDSLRYTKTLLSRLEFPECDKLVEKVDSLLGEDNTDINPNNDLVEAYKIIADLRNQLNSKDSIIKTLSEKANDSNMQNTSSELEENYAKAQDLVESLVIRESSLRKELSRLKSDFDNLKSEKEELSESVSSLSKDNRILKSHIVNMKSKLERISNEESDKIKTLQENFDNSENTIQSLTEQLEFNSRNTKEVYESYFDLRCSQLGINGSIIKKQLGDLTSYSLDELNSHITESFKESNRRNSNSIRDKLPSGIYSARKALSENINSSDYDIIRQNVSAVRNQ